MQYNLIVRTPALCFALPWHWLSDAQPRTLRMSKFPAASSPVSISIKSKALITAASKWAVWVNCLMIRI